MLLVSRLRQEGADTGQAQIMVNILDMVANHSFSRTTDGAAAIAGELLARQHLEGAHIMGLSI